MIAWQNYISLLFFPLRVISCDNNGYHSKSAVHSTDEMSVSLPTGRRGAQVLMHARPRGSAAVRRRTPAGASDSTALARQPSGHREIREPTRWRRRREGRPCCNSGGRGGRAGAGRPPHSFNGAPNLDLNTHFTNGICGGPNDNVRRPTAHEPPPIRVDMGRRPPWTWR